MVTKIVMLCIAIGANYCYTPKGINIDGNFNVSDIDYWLSNHKKVGIIA